MQKNDFNKLIISGHIKNSPYMGTTANGTPVVNFVLCSDFRRKREDFEVTVWGDLAEKSYYGLKPDDRVLIEGHIQKRNANHTCFTYENGLIEVVARRIFSLDKGVSFNELGSQLN